MITQQHNEAEIDSRPQATALRRRNVLEQIGFNVIYWLNAIAVHCVYRLQVHGSENLQISTPFIIALNHTSSLDPFVIGATLKRQLLAKCSWLAREDAVSQNYLQRKIAELGGVIPTKLDKTAIVKATEVLQNNRHLIIFPEGTRTSDGKLQEFHSGIGVLMKRFACPVVPIYLDGTFDAWPTSRPYPKLFCKLSVTIGEPIVADVENHSVDVLTEQVRDVFKTLSKNL